MRSSLSFFAKTSLLFAFGLALILNLVLVLKTDKASNSITLEILKAKAEGQAETGEQNNHVEMYEECVFDTQEVTVGGQTVVVNIPGKMAVCHYQKNSTCSASGDCEKL